MDTVLARDYPTVQAVILVFSAVYVLINLLVDLTYTVLDPRSAIETRVRALANRSVLLRRGGVGIPPETPTWGNIMAEGRALFRVFPHNILFPGVFLAATVLAVNMLGDGLRDQLDPRVSRRL